MLIDTIRFGPVETDGRETVSFDDGLPGLEEYTRFALLRFDENYPVAWLQCLTDPGVALPVIDVFAIEPGYAFDISDGDAGALGLDAPDDARVICVLVIPRELERMTINLAAPIVINARTGRAMQILLPGGDYSARAPAFDAVRRLARAGRG
jgi:flagellar assembly factor FliW